MKMLVRKVWGHWRYQCPHGRGVWLGNCHSQPEAFNLALAHAHRWHGPGRVHA